MNPSPRIIVEAPRLGEGLFEVRIVALFKKPGDMVQADEPLYELESDKATAAIESPCTGRLLAWKVSEGDVIRIGSPVAEIEPLAGTEALSVKLAAPVERPQQRAAFAPPRTRAYARAQGISPAELASIPASGLRLTLEDVDSYIAARPALNGGSEAHPSKLKLGPESGAGAKERRFRQGSAGLSTG